MSLIKILRALQDLAELYGTHQVKRDRLHIRPADLPDSEVLYELSISFDLLDDYTQEMLEPYMENYVLEESNVSPLIQTERKVIRAKNLDQVQDLLGISSLDNMILEDIFDQFIEKYTLLLQKLTGVFHEGKEEGAYFGTKFYVKKIDSEVAFCIDPTDSRLYMLEYSEDEDIPHIYSLDWDDTLVRAIKTLCYSEEKIRFYSVY